VLWALQQLHLPGLQRCYSLLVKSCLLLTLSCSKLLGLQDADGC
jgi:hypothetical protein